MSGTDRDRMHELLCAYLLDEGTPEERAEVERGLEESPELRMELERLRATIGLVQSAYGEPAKLSDEALEEIMHAAGGATPHGLRLVWYRAPIVRAAAAIAAVLLGVLGVVRFTGGEPGGEDTVAKAPFVPSGPNEPSNEVLGAEEALTPVLARLRSFEQAADVRWDRVKTRLDEAQAQSARQDRVAEAARFQELSELAKDAYDRGDMDQAETFVGLLRLEVPEIEEVEPVLGIASAGRRAEQIDLYAKQNRQEWDDRWRSLDLQVENFAARLSIVDAPGDLGDNLDDAALRDRFGGFEAEEQDEARVSHAIPGKEDLRRLENKLAESIGEITEEEKDSSVRARREQSYGRGFGVEPDASLKRAKAAGERPQDSAGVPDAGLRGVDPRTRGEVAGEPTTKLGATVTPETSTGSDDFFLGRQNKKLEAEGKLVAGGRGGGGALDGKPSGTTVTGGGGEATLERKLGQPVADGAASGEAADGRQSGSKAPASPGPVERGRVAGDREALGVTVVADGDDKSVTYVQDFDVQTATIEAVEVPALVELGYANNTDYLLRFGETEQGAFFGSVDEATVLELLSSLGEPVTRYRLGGETVLGPLVDGLQTNAGEGRYGARGPLGPNELGVLVELTSKRVIGGCRRLEHESPRDMYFRYWGDNPFVVTAEDRLSTFSVDVDTASYALARRYLREGHLPTKDQVRTEEFVNYFEPDLPAPTEETFAIHTELAPSLFGGTTADRWMLRVGVRGKEVSESERQPLTLTFVVDTSGSMRENGRLELVKHAMRLLVGKLDARDTIAIVAYSNEARQVLGSTSAAQRGVVEAAIYGLSPGGSTNAEGGLMLGYEMALAALTSGSHNRVVLLSDGVANVGETDQDRINEKITRHRDQGIYLNTIGVGMNNHNDVFLEQLADKGDGVCDYIDNAAAAERAIVERFTGAFQPIASDVKIQVEFDPAQVTSYRLLGYENRDVADADFRNDAVDAGEVGAGHQVTALFELERSGDGFGEPLARVNLRWKAPKVARQDASEVDVYEVSSYVTAADALGSHDTASYGFRRSVLAAQLAEFLRRSSHAVEDSYQVLLDECAKLLNEQPSDELAEFTGMVKMAVGLGLPSRLERTDLQMTVDEYRQFLYLKSQLEELNGRQLSDREVEELQRVNDDLEGRVREIVRRELNDWNARR